MNADHKPPSVSPNDLVEGIDFYREGQAIVFTEAFHRRRGYCCESGCRHCPYGFKSKSAKAAENSLGDQPREI